MVLYGIKICLSCLAGFLLVNAYKFFLDLNSNIRFMAHFLTELLASQLNVIFEE